MPSEIDGCANVHFDAVETKSRQGPGIVFLHEVEEGPANRSYGLQVARLAGVPADTLKQAQRYFARLDKFNARDDAQHDLFATTGGDTRRPHHRSRFGCSRSNRGSRRSIPMRSRRAMRSPRCTSSSACCSASGL